MYKLVKESVFSPLSGADAQRLVGQFFEKRNLTKKPQIEELIVEVTNIEIVHNTTFIDYIDITNPDENHSNTLKMFNKLYEYIDDLDYIKTKYAIRQQNMERELINIRNINEAFEKISKRKYI